jgi:hypothetical protein
VAIDHQPPRQPRTVRQRVVHPLRVERHFPACRRRTSEDWAARGRPLPGFVLDWFRSDVACGSPGAWLHPRERRGDNWSEAGGEAQREHAPVRVARERGYSGSWKAPISNTRVSATGR